MHACWWPGKVRSHVIKSHDADYINALAQDCSNSIAKALELLQSCANLSI